MVKKPKGYKEYPNYHFAILKDFREGKESVSVDMTRELAYTNRHQLYRFFKALRAAAINGDPVAERLSNLAKNLIIHVTKDPPGLLIRVNPLSVALSDFDPGGEPATSVETVEIDPEDIERIIRERNKEVDN